jgi:hypothetical protein
MHGLCGEVLDMSLQPWQAQQHFHLDTSVSFGDTTLDCSQKRKSARISRDLTLAAINPCHLNHLASFLKQLDWFSTFELRAS